MGESLTSGRAEEVLISEAVLKGGNETASCPMVPNQPVTSRPIMEMEMRRICFITITETFNPLPIPVPNQFLHWTGLVRELHQNPEVLRRLEQFPLL